MCCVLLLERYSIQLELNQMNVNQIGPVVLNIRIVPIIHSFKFDFTHLPIWQAQKD